jgi:hypothetical protein
MIKQIQVTNIRDKKVWIEDDFSGDKYVMIKHDIDGFEPFCYCTFHYDYAYTSNSSIKARAEMMARSLGADEPIEHKSRPFILPLPE